jgi:hypothetical protein
MSTLLTAQSLRVDTAFGTLFDSLSLLKKGDRMACWAITAAVKVR